jgi:hypothetical protein
MKKLAAILVFCCLSLALSAQRFVSQAEAKTAAVHYMAPKFGDQQYTKDNILAVHELKQKGHTLIYEVLFKNNTSVLLSGVKSCKAIVGYRFKTGGVSVLNQSKDVVSPGMNIFLEKCCIQILYAIEEMENKNWISGEWKELLKPEVSGITAQGGVYGPYLTSSWGQTRAYPKVCDGYNYYVKETIQQCACASISKCPAGCVAVAMGQIMRYWQYPAKSPYTGEHYDWSNMPDTLKAKSARFEQERKAIARLLRDCGESAEMQYCYAPKRYGCQSFAWPMKACDGFINKFNYSSNAERKLRSSFNTKSWKAMLIDNIKRGFPVLYASASLNVKDYAECGHAYVCDGYNENTEMFHFNWGYDGEANGWYTLDNLVIKLSKQPYNWNHLERMVINIYPSYIEEVKDNIYSGKVAEK